MKKKMILGDFNVEVKQPTCYNNPNKPTYIDLI